MQFTYQHIDSFQEKRFAERIGCALGGFLKKRCAGFSRTSGKKAGNIFQIWKTLFSRIQGVISGR